ncbi:MAG: endonuclease/exonuclease/phosphatase family protein [Rhodobacteraceae bacterium]|nr:endonuclease/exonuclease/phosphatase family protein [Paracoccaceae bacterium]
MRRVFGYSYFSRQVLSSLLTIAALDGLAVAILCLLFDIRAFGVFYSLVVYITLLCATGALVAIGMWRRNAVAWVVLAGLLATTGASLLIPSHYAPEITAEMRDEPRLLRVLSFNVLAQNRKSGPAIADAVLELDPDVAIFLEARPLDTELDRLRKVYPYQIDCADEPRSWRCDSIMLSKYPLENAFRSNLSMRAIGRMVSAVITVDGQRLRVMSAHFSKPYHPTVQHQEVRRVLDKLDGEHLPLVLTGDFNASIFQPSTRLLLRETGLRPGPKEPATWPIRAGRWGVPIDHIFASPPLVIRETHRIENNYGSNHFGIYSDIVLAPDARSAPNNDVVAATP